MRYRKPIDLLHDKREQQRNDAEVRLAHKLLQQIGDDGLTLREAYLHAAIIIRRDPNYPQP